MKRALLVIDVQNDYFSDKLRVTHPQGSLENILAAMDGAARAGIPVITVQHSNPPEAGAFAKGSAGWQLHPEIARRQVLPSYRKDPGQAALPAPSWRPGSGNRA